MSIVVIIFLHLPKNARDAGVMMQNENENIEPKEGEELGLTMADASYSLQSILETLVPASEISVSDALGDTHTVKTVASARVQIKVLREFEKIQEMDIGSMPFSENIADIVKTMVAIAANEEVLMVISKCFSLSQPMLVRQVCAKADEIGFPYEKGDLASADLFPLEEMIASIVPLFIRLAKRAGQAVNSIAANL
jgi:hypothetical protein